MHSICRKTANETIKQINASMITKQRDLEEERIKAKEHYEKTVNTALRNEKDGQAERNKLQLQLQALIQKYDQTMAEKIREEYELKEAYSIERAKMDEFLVYYNREEALHHELFIKKEEEFRRQQEARVMAFRLFRAVRLIQRWFKRFKARMKAAEKSKATKVADRESNSPPKKDKK